MSFTTLDGNHARPLRIAQLAPPVEPVPPTLYGGTERVVSVLTEELVRRGHKVTLFASGDSCTAARLIPTIDVAVWHHPTYTDALPFMAMAVDQVYRMSGEFDVVHNHMGFLSFAAARAQRSLPTLSTLHSRLDIPEWQPLYRRFADMPVVSISDAQRRPIPWANWQETVYNGIELAEFPYQPEPGSYLAFLGRISPEKGLHIAIRAARRVGLPLKIAARMPLDQPGNPEAQEDWRYFREEVKPLLSEPGIEYVGELAGAEKAKLLAGALAFLFPIRWPEPFGLVMAESLACGTPVIAFRRGSAPEVVKDGVTGFVVDDEDGMVAAIERAATIQRARCRAEAEARFSPAAMADRYELVYRRLIAAGSHWLAEERRWRDDQPVAEAAAESPAYSESPLASVGDRDG